MKAQAFSHRLPLLSGAFCRAYIVTMRPYLLFVSGITGIAGMSFAPNVSGIRAALIGIASFLSYGFGQALTDCFQTDTDALSAPYRPLTQGVITRAQVMMVSLAGLAVCLAILGWLHPLNLLLGTFAAVGLATYTFFKRRWWGGPFYNAWIVVILFCMAFIAAGGAVQYSPTVVLTMLAVFFGYANFVLGGYFKDIEADRATGYATMPVVYGRRTAAGICDAFASLMILAGLAAIVSRWRGVLPSGAPAASLMFVAAGVYATLLSQVRLHRVETDSGAHAAIGPVVHGYVLFFAGIASLMKPAWALPLVCFYLTFVVTLALRPAKNQI